MDKLTYKYINLQSLRDNTGGNLEIEIEIMQLFIDLVDEFIASLEEGLLNENWEKIYDAAHKIKPNVTMFGISSMDLSIRQLEENFRGPVNFEEIDGLVKFVVTTFKEIKREIEWELNTVENN